jgi:hypothetical protein
VADVGFKCNVRWRDESGRFAAAMDEGARRAQEEAGEIGAAVASALAPKRSGELAASVRPNGAGFEATAPYAAAQEEGAGPHLIGTGFDSVLVNEAEGFGPVLGPVEHPGNPATHFMRDALKLVNARLMGIIRSKMP